jgi:hypothetical protein
MLSRSSRPKRPAANRFRPRLDALEDRSVPSVVLTTEDNGDNVAPTPGSLRAAILAANRTPGTERITFDLKPDDPRHFYYRNDGDAGHLNPDRVVRTTAAIGTEPADIDPDWPHSWWSIQPHGELPKVTDVVFIDGYSQPGASVNHLSVGSDAILRIELNGDKAGAGTGLRIHASEVTVHGLVINRFGGSGISIAGSSEFIEGNYLGTDPSGTVDRGNESAGLQINGGGQIGGRTAMARNLISANRRGVVLSNGGRDFETRIEGNYLGLDATGIRPLGNTEVGVLIVSAPRTWVGGGDPGAGNVISGNGTGVSIKGSSRALIGRRFNSVVQGNIIGLDASGKFPLGNTDGIQIRTSNNLIGGLTPNPGRGVGNVISGNTGNGISVIRERVGAMIAPVVEGTVVQGNIIGLDPAGMAPLGNGLAGFRTRDAGALVGGTAPGARNIISANQAGVRLSNSGTDYHPVIQGNYIGTDPTGNLDRGNSETGVTVGSAPGTRVGGAAPGAGNVISGNGTGVFINSISHPVIAGAYNSLVQGNIIGLNATATQPVGNTTGVLITNSYNLIGGTTLAARNLISGNLGNGLQIVHTQPLYTTIHNLVIGNRIGTDWTGIRSFGNGLDGVLIGDGAKSNLVRDNRILFNARDGISLENADTNTVHLNENYFNGRDGLRVDAESTGNILIENTLLDNEVLDAHDESAGTGTAHTANQWLLNTGRTEDPIGILRFHR